jgi:hypothetical protein
MTDQFLCYVEHWDIAPQTKIIQNISTCGEFPEPNTNLYLLKQALQSNKQPMGDIIPLKQIQAFVDLVPRMQRDANAQFTKTNLVF